jgi:hypothetical protein
MEDYKQEEWVSVYQSALIEVEEAKMSERIKAACEAIVARMEKLSTLPEPHPKERQAIEDALRGQKLLALLSSPASTPFCFLSLRSPSLVLRAISWWLLIPLLRPYSRAASPAWL